MNPDALAYGLGSLGGLIAGSFLNVVAWRLPRRESLVAPRSRCPACATPIKPYDNVPLVSWLLLRGRCRACAAPIPVRYPLVEFVTAALWVLVLVVNGVERESLIGIAFMTMLVPVTLIDLDHRIIPNRLLAAGAAAGVVLVALTDAGSAGERAIAAAGAGGFLLAAALAYPRGMGMGDVKLAAVMGLYLGRAVVPALFVAFLAGSVVGAVVIARKGAAEGRKTALPFGPFLALGGLAGLLAGQQIVDWYLRTFA